ncbi:MAG: pilus assembly protein PilP [Candidatus Aminicenantes bacterium]|nr:pilus assembly protein PilP [Candidatus Aminicenantes bacterium]
MRKAAILLIGISLAGLAPLFAQEAAAEPPPQTAPMLSVQTGFTYNPEGRRDPFKDLLGGRDLKEKSVLGENQIFIDDLVLFGIVKNQTVYTALIGMPQGFPMFAKIGDKFADGYVLSITATQVVLRKTHERGIPLMRPRDVIKEITEEL